MTKRSLLLSLLFVAGGLQAQDTPDLDRGQEIAQTICAGCHGVDGNSALPENPKIAGQVEEYIYKQLRDYSSIDGEEPRRHDAVMASMVAPLNDDDKRAVAAWFSSQELEPEAARNPDTIEQGQEIWRAGIKSKGVAACAACHGPAGAGMPAEYPAIAGQYSDYTFQQLQAFREGDRANDPNSMMRDIALKMTDAEMRAVADYAAGLRDTASMR